MWCYGDFERRTVDLASSARYGQQVNTCNLWSIRALVSAFADLRTGDGNVTFSANHAHNWIVWSSVDEEFSELIAVTGGEAWADCDDSL